MSLLFLMAQIAVGSSPPPPPAPPADFSCRLFDSVSKSSKLNGTVRGIGKPWGTKVYVSVDPEKTDLPKLVRFETNVYGDSFDAISLSDARDVHYYITMPQAYGTNGYIRVLIISKTRNGRGTATWVATGLCNFDFKATDK